MNFTFLLQTSLFKGCTLSDLQAMLACLSATEKTYIKGETILKSGYSTEVMGIMEDGSAILETIDFWGHKNILNSIESGMVFAETYACLSGEKLMVNVIANSNCTVLFLNLSKLSRLCSNNCSFHNRLISNLLEITARKNLYLTLKIFHTNGKTIREKLLSYFSFQAQKEGCVKFEIPFDRQQLADYLGVDRSAMSAQLSLMQKEGLISFKKNQFIILVKE